MTFAPILSTTEQHAQLLHGPESRGRVVIAWKGSHWRQMSVEVADLPYVARQLSGNVDTYITQN